MQLAHKVLFDKRRSDSGDTIVEVLLCIAIVGAVILGAYSLASRSLQQGVSASEHTQAIKLVESQLELLKFREKSMGSLPDADWAPFATTNHFCLDSSANDSSSAVWGPALNHGSPNTLKIDNVTNYNPVCVQNNNKYFIDITIPTGASGAPTYLITIRWIPPGNGPISQSQLYYRFPEKVVSVGAGVFCTPTPNDMLLVLDASSSMSLRIGGVSTAPRRWDALKTATDQFINQSEITASGNHMGIITFDDNAVLEQRLTSNISDLTTAAANMVRRDSTYLLPGLDLASTEYSSRGRASAQHSLLILTDGEFNESNSAVTTRTNALKASGVRIFTIGIDTNPSIRNRLSNIAGNGGTFAAVDSAAELNQVFLELADQITCA